MADESDPGAAYNKAAGSSVGSYSGYDPTSRKPKPRQLGGGLGGFTPTNKYPTTAPETDPDLVVRPGWESDRASVLRVQRALNRYGANLAEDGAYGPNTAALMKAYEEYKAQKIQHAYGVDVSTDAGELGRKMKEIWWRQQPGHGPTPDPGAPPPVADPDYMAWAVAQDAARRAEAEKRAAEARRQAAEAAKSNLRRGAEIALGRAKQTAGTVGGAVLRAADVPIEQLVRQPLAAAQRSGLTGGNFAEGITAAATALPIPGFGRLGDEHTQQAVKDTNSKEERRKLVELGALASPGEILSGRALGKLDPNQVARMPVEAPGIPNSASGGLDFAIQVGLDPVNLAVGGVGKLARVSERAATSGLRAAGKDAGETLARRLIAPGSSLADETLVDLAIATGREGSLGVTRAGAQAAGRAEFLTGRTGTKVLDAAVDAARSARDSTALTKAVAGLDPVAAMAILDVAKTGTTAEVRAAFAAAFSSGEWAPRISAARQVTGLGVGRSVAPRGLGIQKALRRAVRGEGVGLAHGGSTRAGAALEQTLSRAAERSETFVGDITKRVQDVALTLTDPQRIDRLQRLAGASPVAAFRDAAMDELARVAKMADPEERTFLLTRLEAVESVLAGNLGESAQRQAIAEMTQGFKAGPRDGGVALVERAAGHAGADLPVISTSTTRPVLKAKIERLPNELRSGLLEDLEKAKGRAGLGRIKRAIVALEDPDVTKAAVDLTYNAAERVQQGVITTARTGLGKRTAQAAGRVLLDINESIAPASIPFARGVDQGSSLIMRVEAGDRWAATVDLDDVTRSVFRQQLEAAKTEQQVFDAVEDALGFIAKKNGVSAEELKVVYQANRTAARSRAGQHAAFGVDSAGNAIRDRSFTLTQRIEDIPLPDADDLATSLKLLKDSPGDLASRLAEAKGDPNKILEVLHKVHQAWKFSIVTNAYMPITGAVGGFVSGGDNIQERLKRAGVGAAIGMFGPVRYVARVAGVEERLRYLMERGFTPQEWVPGLARHSANSGIDRPFTWVEMVSARGVGAARIGDSFAVADEGIWTTLNRKDSRYVDGWWRIVNHQINPESDELARLALNGRAGLMSAEEVATESRLFLKTPEGVVVRNRLAGAVGGTGGVKEILARYESFVGQFTTPELALERLKVAQAKLGSGAGEIDRALLKGMAKQGEGPEVIHAVKSWVVPKSMNDVVQFRNKVLADFVLEGPTTKLNRIPLAQAIYADEYRTLRAAGVRPDRAQEIANHAATIRTNRVMFQVSDESRFAKKVDFVAPFQQPKEELVRVWGKLVKDNPIRTVKVTRLAALAFNNGKETGAFYQDAYGEWRMSIPGSGRLSNMVMGFNPGFNDKLRDLFFFSQGTYGERFGLGLPLPSPGGPYWSAIGTTFAKHYPDVYRDMPAALKEWLFPVGVNGALTPSPMRRLWMAQNGAVPFWEVLGKDAMTAELNKWDKEVALQLRWAHLQKSPGDLDWWPSAAEVRAGAKGFFTMWAISGTMFPGSPEAGPFPAREWFNKYYASLAPVVDEKTGNILSPYQQVVNTRPDLAPFLLATTTVKDHEGGLLGPDDFAHWSDAEATYAEQYVAGQRRQKDVQEFVAEARAQARKTQAYSERRSNVAQNPDPWDREAADKAWREKYPDLADDWRSDYAKETELASALNLPPVSRDAAIDTWRKTYNVTPREYERLKAKIETEGLRPDPWRQARYAEDVFSAVGQQPQGSREAYVTTLLPAEQVRYWKTVQSNLNNWDNNRDPQAVLDEYNHASQRIGDLYADNPSLLGNKKKSVWQQSVERWQGDTQAQINATYDEIAKVKEAKDQAFEAKDWKSYYALKDKIDAMRLLVTHLVSGLYNTVPDVSSLTPFMQEVAAHALDTNNADVLAGLSGGAVPWVATREELRVERMPMEIRTAYVADLVNALNIESGTGKKFWEWLTPFQQSYLERHLPTMTTDVWKAQHPEDDPSGGGNGKWAQGPDGKWHQVIAGKFFEGNNVIGQGAGELAYALELFNQYNKRGALTKPAAYDEYLALPRNPAVRSQYLKAHPEVGEWIKLGPLANMPEVERFIVSNIMIKYGKWEGDERSMEEITDLSFAREQLKRWSRRPEGGKPAEYDTWLSMPSGPEKVLYMQQHPEVKSWLALGPMANMPDEYQTIVRDIMLRYGEWTQQQDPMSDLVAEFYRQPGYARQAFLAAHPELNEYWASKRTPEENAQHALADQYFAIQDPSAKKAFMLANPQLQDWFLDQRRKRYEKFLNQTAQFMGSNPELFRNYLDRQDDVLAEILRRFSTPNLMREAPTVSKQGTRTTGAEGAKRRRSG